jgi:predicted transcriptional regulator
METKKPNPLTALLPHGKIKEMADEAGVTVQAVSNALRKAKPTNRFVQQALRIAKECGSLEAAQTLASIAG